MIMIIVYWGLFWGPLLLKTPKWLWERALEGNLSPCKSVPQGPNDTQNRLWSIYHIGSVMGCDIWLQFYGSFGPFLN